MRDVAIRSFCCAIGLALMAQDRAFSLTYEGIPPPGGDCAAIAAQRGPSATWYGEFSGNYYDTFRDVSFPIAARGCFISEYDCRRWLHESMSYGGQGGILYARCRLGAPGY
jgi:hypothetical protein